MTDQNDTQPAAEGQAPVDAPEEAVVESAPASEQEPQADADASGDGAAIDPLAQIAALQAEVEKARDERLRALAELENTRRRAAKEAEDGRKFAIQSFAKDLLSVADNLSRAMDAIPADQRENAGVKAVVTGVEMTRKELDGVLGKHRVRKVEAEVGKPFDAHVHQAMAEVENSGQPAGSIAQVYLPGYMLEERLLRAAMVLVAKGDPAPSSVDTQA